METRRESTGLLFVARLGPKTVVGHKDPPLPRQTHANPYMSFAAMAYVLGDL